MLEKFRVKITILASLIVAIYAYFSHQSLLRTCYALIITIVVFYFLGGFIEISINKDIEHIEQEQEEQKEEDFITEESEYIEEQQEQEMEADSKLD